MTNLYFDNDEEVKFILGPCQIESEEHCLHMAGEIAQIMGNVPFVFKASYDKANRSRADSPRGVGKERGLGILWNIHTLSEGRINTITDVHTVEDVLDVSRIVDIIQIPALLCRQTDLLKEVDLCSNEFGTAVMVKKGQFIAPNEVKNILSKFTNPNVFICERGTTFGYNNLVVDMRNIRAIKEDCDNVPIVIDATHSVQFPGGGNGRSGGDRRYAEDIACAAVACGVSAVFLEVHDDPDNALSDGPNSIDMKDLPRIIEKLTKIDRVVKGLV